MFLLSQVKWDFTTRHHLKREIQNNTQDLSPMINVGVLGATGAVGQRFVELLADHPWFNLTTLAASERSAGKQYGKVVNWRLETPFPEKIAKTQGRKY